MTIKEVKLMESHVLRGVDILLKIPIFPSDVLQVILQHHENCAGTGYPSKLLKNKTQPLARLIAVMDEFCELTIGDKNQPGMSAQDAILRMFVLYSEILDPTFLLSLAKVYGVNVDQHRESVKSTGT